MKKLLLSLGLVLTLTASAGAETFTEGYFTYETSGAKTVTLTSVQSKDASDAKITSYVIPSSVSHAGVDYSVTAIGESVFRWSSATSVTLPATLETIGSQAFSGASSLTAIELPAGLKSIGDYAFSSAGITSIDVPASVESIGGSAFFTCKSLQSVTLHEGLKSIGTSAFYKVPLSEIALPASLQSLGDKAFLNCEKLVKVNIPSGIKVIGVGMFQGCTSLTSISLPESLTEIGLECFLKTALTEITIPASVETIGTSAFACSNIAKIEVAAGNKNFTVINGVLYGADKRLLYAVPMTGVTEVKVDAKCVGINGGAFWGSKVAKVTLPDGMLAIDDYAFCQSALAEINFPSSLTYIGEQGFASTELVDVTLPENMPLVFDGAFAGITTIRTLTIPSGVKLIYNHAFHNDKTLTSVTCLGSVAPEIDDVYEDYDSPFFGIPETTPLYIPKGSLESYKNAGWGSYFKIVEGELGSFAYVSMTPADGTVLGKYADMKIDIEFSSDLTIVNATPEVYLRKGSELSGAVIAPEDKWNATPGDNKQSVRIWASDYDSMVQGFSPEEDTEYYLVIPAGVVKNSAGELNERIVVKWVGPAAPKPLEIVSIDPADGTVLPSGYFNMSFTVEFADNVTILDYAPDAVLRENDAENGKKIDPDLSWKVTRESDKVVRIWAADYDSMVQSFKVNDASVYFMTIPAGIFKNDAGDKNEQIVIELKGSAAGIEGIEAGNGATELQHFDITGRPVAPETPGLHIIRMSDGSVRKVNIR